LPRNSVGTRQVVNGSLQTIDLGKTRTRGAQRPRGPERSGRPAGCPGAHRRDRGAGPPGTAGPGGDEALHRAGRRRHAHQEQRRDLGRPNKPRRLPRRLRHQHHELRLSRDGGAGRGRRLRGLPPVHEPDGDEHRRHPDLRREEHPFRSAVLSRRLLLIDRPRRLRRDRKRQGGRHGANACPAAPRS
jgi:hypothetical protein